MRMIKKAIPIMLLFTLLLLSITMNSTAKDALGITPPADSIKDIPAADSPDKPEDDTPTLNVPDEKPAAGSPSKETQTTPTKPEETETPSLSVSESLVLSQDKEVIAMLEKESEFIEKLIPTQLEVAVPNMINSKKSYFEVVVTFGGSPVENALVTFQGEQYWTNYLGSVHVLTRNVAKSDSYKVSIEKEGYLPVDSEIMVVKYHGRSLDIMIPDPPEMIGEENPGMGGGVQGSGYQTP